MELYRELTNKSKSKLIKQLGLGGFGRVTLYKTNEGEEYVIKMMRYPATADGILNEFEKEVRALAELSECPAMKKYMPETVGAYGSKAENKMFIIQRYIPTRELFDIIMSKTPIDEKSGMALIDNLIDSLNTLHSCGYIHRDLKPENILIRNDDITSPLLIDFGLACKIPCSDRRVIGSYAYLSPMLKKNMNMRRERTSGKYNENTDTYALGKILQLVLHFNIQWVGENKEKYETIIKDMMSKNTVNNSNINNGNKIGNKRVNNTDSIIEVKYDPTLADNKVVIVRESNARNNINETRKRKRNEMSISPVSPPSESNSPQTPFSLRIKTPRKTRKLRRK